MIVQRCSVDDIPALTADDPFARSQLRYRADGQAWHAAGAVAFTRLDVAGRIHQLAGLGEPEPVAELVAAVVHEVPEVPHLTVPRAAATHLPDGLLGEPSHWDLRATTTPPPVQAGEEGVRWLAATEESDVAALLSAANPTSSAWPGDAKVRRWAGIRDEEGTLLACLADTSGHGVGHMSGIATHPRARGQGLGATITARATRRMLGEGADLVTLGMYADNDTARRLYDRLGFTDEHHFTSGAVAC